MLKSFVWMFKTVGFKKHFLGIFLGSLLLYLLAYGLIFINIPILILVAYVLSVIPTLYIFGYFWNLVEQIINRDSEILASNIYDGKIKEGFLITLPRLDLFQNIWRGISSIFAILLLILPFIAIFICVFKYGAIDQIMPVCSIVMTLYCAFLVPAMLWNYAHKNSVFSVWNMRKVIYLMGNYPLKYFLNVVMIILLVVLNSFIDSILVRALPTTAAMMSHLTIEGVVYALCACLIFGVKYLYFVYVYAYLLGTIAPTSEA